MATGRCDAGASVGRGPWDRGPCTAKSFASQKACSNHVAFMWAEIVMHVVSRWPERRSLSSFWLPLDTLPASLQWF